MSVCDFHPSAKGSTISDSSKKEENYILQDELVWGLSYRHFKKKEKQVPIPSKKSPMDIPFKLCREKQRQELVRSRSPSKQSYAKSKSKSKSEKQPSLLEKSVMSQNKYMDYLSTPRKIEEPPPPKKKRCHCEIEPCPPRFVQLAVPNKRRVYENWKAYHEMLPTEVIVRYEQLLHTDKNLEPKEARYYYKRLDKKKRKELKKKRMLRKKKQAEKEKGDKAWLKEQINLTAEAIMEYIKEEPLFTLNFKQLMLSDSVLDRLDKSDVLKKPSRKTKNHYKKTIIEVSDKLAVWMDTLTRFVDVQAIDSEEDIPPLTISSLGEEEGEEEEEEGEEEEEEEGESEAEAGMLFEEHKEMWEEGEEGVWGTDLGVGDQETEEQMLTDLYKKEGGGDEEDELDMDLLAKLIEILENSPEEVLQSLVNEEKMPNVTYADILEKLKALQAGLLDREPKKKPLEEVLADWAKRNDPERVDDKLLREIRNAAEMLGEWWTGRTDKVEPVVEATQEAEEVPEEREEAEAAEVEAEEAEQEKGEGADETGYAAEEEDVEEAPGEDEQKAEEPVVEEAVTEEAAAEEVEAPGEETEAAEETREEEGAEVKVEEEGGEGEKVEEAAEERVEEEKGVQGEEVEGEEGEEEGEEGEGLAGEGEEEGMEMAAEGGDIETQLAMEELMEYAEVEKEELLEGLEGEGVVEVPSRIEEEEEEEGEGEERKVEARKEIAVLYEPGMEIEAAEVGQIIRGHKPSVTFEHSPDMVCCLSLKTWAVWLLEITHNAHSWTKWVHGVIRQVREFAATIRGDVLGPDGRKKVLYKQDWRDFAKEVDEMIVAWRQYSAHVKELSTSIVDNFHGKQVKCCPKCLQDHLIKNVVTAHETLQALTEAMNCAGYWQRTLDEIVNKTSALADVEAMEQEITSEESSEGDEETDAYIEELPARGEEDEDCDSVYEIEEINFTSVLAETNRRPSKSPPGPN